MACLRDLLWRSRLSAEPLSRAPAAGAALAARQPGARARGRAALPPPQRAHTGRRAVRDAGVRRRRGRPGDMDRVSRSGQGFLGLGVSDAGVAQRCGRSSRSEGLRGERLAWGGVAGSGERCGAALAVFDWEAGRAQRAPQGCERTAVDSGGREEHCKLAKCGLYLAGWGGPARTPPPHSMMCAAERWAGGHGRLARPAAALCCTGGGCCARGLSRPVCGRREGRLLLQVFGGRSAGWTAACEVGVGACGARTGCIIGAASRGGKVIAAARFTPGSFAAWALGRCPQIFPGSAGRALRPGGLLFWAVPRARSARPAHSFSRPSPRLSRVSWQRVE